MKHLPESEFRHEKRSNYMSLSDLFQDLKTESLVNQLPKLTKFRDQMTLMKELEKRNDISQDKYFELLEKCNGI